MGFNLSKGERFDLSKSSVEDSVTSPSNGNSRNPTNKKDSDDRTMIIVIAIMVIVIIVNASLWYHVINSATPSSTKKISTSNANQ